MDGYSNGRGPINVVRLACAALAGTVVACGVAGYIAIVLAGALVTRADLTAWQEYVRLECGRFYDHCDGETYIWSHTPAAERHLSRVRGTSEEAAFTGPWHVVRKHVTTEFRQWVEEYEATERHTLSQWREARQAERSEVAFTESAEHTLGQLSELRRLIAERDALVVEAAKRGATKVSIADAVGLSRQQVHSIIAAAELAPVIPIRPVVEDDCSDMRQLASGEWVEVF